MNNIFVNADYQLIVDVGIDISTAPTLQIIYRKPNSTTENTVTASLYSTTSLYYDITPAINDTAGTWLFRAKITDLTGKIYYSEIIRIDIKEAWFPF